MRAWSNAPISVPSGMASSMATAPAASVTQAFRELPESAARSRAGEPVSPARGRTASYPAPRMASTSCWGAASAGSNTTLARCAIRSTRADSTPAVARRAASTWCWQRGAGHAQHRKGQRFLSVRGHLSIRIRLRPNLQVMIPNARYSRPWRERRWQQISCRRGLLSRAQPGRSHADFVHHHARRGGERLAHAPHTGAAMHSIDFQRKFRHFLSLWSLFDDSWRGAMIARA